MRALIPLVVLAGCAGLPAPQPQAARLSADVLTVTLTDGSVCRADWRAGAGRLAPCGPGYDWQVEVVRDPNILRQLAEGALGALGGADLLAPMAVVTLTDPRGAVFRFASPPPVD